MGVEETGPIRYSSPNGQRGGSLSTAMEVSLKDTLGRKLEENHLNIVPVSHNAHCWWKNAVSRLHAVFHFLGNGFMEGHLMKNCSF